jgi:membrane-bound ClpP family serine protease
METQIHPEALHYFTHHLDSFGLPQKISLLLYSRGGSTLAGWSIANVIRQFCQHFEVIVPATAQSAATLIALAADEIMMTKQATLGPIDPSTNGALNPPDTWCPGEYPAAHQRRGRCRIP